MRIFAVYFTIRFLIPKYLLERKIWWFIVSYCLFILLVGCAQQTFTYFFFENQDTLNSNSLFNLRQIIRPMVLVNSTVFFLSSIYILQLYYKEKDKNSTQDQDDYLELKSNRRTYRINPNDIFYIEGLGNYVNYIMKNDNKITVYQSLKDCLISLKGNFIQTQKSYIVNKDHIQSYNSESIETT